MTFRPPLHKRWKYPFLLCLPAAGVWAGLFLMFHRLDRHSTISLYLIGFSLVAFFALVRKSWMVWTTSVSLDDVGLRWSRGSAGGAMRWEEISELGFSYTPGRTRLQIGPVRALSKMLHPLPLLPRGLYEQLKSRIGGLPPDVEQDYYRRTGGSSPS
jgi:hypothetical protein